MTKKEIVEYIKQNMPNIQGSEEEKEVKTALYIYITLGKMKSFDEKYYYGNSETKKKIYRLAEKEKHSENAMVEKKKLICVSLTYLYCDILKEFEIKAIGRQEEEWEHVYPIILLKNGTTVMADLQLDLENIQSKSKLRYFQYKSENQEIIDNMLIELGYIEKESDYKDEVIEKLKNKVKGKNPHEALRDIIECENLYKNNEEMENIEVNKFYRNSFKKIVPHFWEKRIFTFNCYKEREDKQRDYILCVFSEEDTIQPYLFSQKEKKFKKIEISKMKQLEEEGLVLGAKPKENGSKKLKKYIEKQNHNEKVKSI